MGANDAAPRGRRPRGGQSLCSGYSVIVVDPDGATGPVLLRGDGLPWRFGDESTHGTSMGRRRYVLVSVMMLFQIMFVEICYAVYIYNTHVFDDIFAFVLKMWGRLDPQYGTWGRGLATKGGPRI